MTSSDFSLRLCAFSVLSARIWNATSASGTRMAGTNFALSFSSTTRRWLPFGVQYTPGFGDIATIGSTKRSIFLTISWSRLAWVGERSRWYGVGLDLGHRQQAEDVPVIAHRLAVDGQRLPAVALDLLGQGHDLTGRGLVREHCPSRHRRPPCLTRRPRPRRFPVDYAREALPPATPDAAGADRRRRSASRALP